MTNTPSPEEVAKAREYLLTRNMPEFPPGEAGSHVRLTFTFEIQPLAELLASYAAEQGTDFALEAERQSERAESWAKAAENYRHELQAAESRLTSLREGLRRLVTAARAIEVADDGSHGAAIGIHAVQSALCEAESLLAGLAEKKES